MAKTLAEAQANYAASGDKAARNYEAAKPTMGADWSAGMSEFLGQPPGPSVTANYNGAVAGARYKPGNPDKWARNLVRKMTS